MIIEKRGVYAVVGSTKIKLPTVDDGNQWCCDYRDGGCEKCLVGLNGRAEDAEIRSD